MLGLMKIILSEFNSSVMQDKIYSDLIKLSDPEKKKVYPRFFKTGKGEYGEGDKFLGVTVPNCRLISKKYKDLELPDIEKVLQSKYHEERWVSLMILSDRFKKADKKEKEEIVNFYFKNLKFINNWDFVDSSAPNILGVYLLNFPDSEINFRGKKYKGFGVLNNLAISDDLWERRISIISTFPLIKAGDFDKTIEISEILLNDKHDLIHKAVGWMLREIGKVNQKTEEKFLKKHYKKMPRTALRYAIEKFTEPLRKAYIAGTI